MSDDVVFDEKSGISIEEQQEILTQINGIAEKNRRHLSQRESGNDKKVSINAKKSGALFPLIFNIGAIIVLCAGAFLLIQCNAMRNIQIRTGAADYDLGLTGVQQGTSDELALAMRELERLTTEQERIDAVDALISGGLVTVSDLIQENEFDQAAFEVEELRQYLNMDFLAASHAFQSRRTFYNQLLDFADTLIEDARRQFDLIILNARLEEIVSDLHITIDSLEDQRNTLTQTVETKDGAIASLETQRDNLINTLGERDGTITYLEGQRNTLTQTVSARDGTITSLEAQRNTLNQTIAARDSAIASLETQRNTLNQTITARDGTITSLEAQRNTLNQTIAVRDSAIASLEIQRNTLNQTIAARDSTIAGLNERVAELDRRLVAIQELIGN